MPEDSKTYQIAEQLVVILTAWWRPVLCRRCRVYERRFGELRTAIYWFKNQICGRCDVIERFRAFVVSFHEQPRSGWRVPGELAGDWRIHFRRANQRKVSVEHERIKRVGGFSLGHGQLLLGFRLYGLREEAVARRREGPESKQAGSRHD